MRLQVASLVLTLCSTVLWAGNAGGGWLTPAERSGFRTTPRYRETITFCRKLESASPLIHVTQFGLSPQGRPLPLVVVDASGTFSPELAHRRGRTIVLIMSGIHAGEIDGKDASLMLLRDIAVKGKWHSLLDGVTLLFIPIFNVDGHERFGPYNRMNQNGPREMGWRTTAQNLNLNRDWLKADAPEMQAWLRLFNRWLPDLMVDIHVTDGADFQYVMQLGLETGPNVAEPLRTWTKRVLQVRLLQQLNDQGVPALPFFWQRNRRHIEKGIVGWSASPRYSNGYGAIQNRVFMLVENHVLKDYRTRVQATYRMLVDLLQIVQQEKAHLKEVNRQADRQTAEHLAGRALPLVVRASLLDSTLIDFAGVAYRLEHSDLFGDDWVHWLGTPRTYRLPFFNHLVAVDSVVVPYAYLIPAQWQDQLRRLRRHGVRIFRLARDTVLTVETYRLKNPRWQPRPFEGHHLLQVEVEVEHTSRRFPAGTAVILCNQRTNRVIVHALEPRAPDSFLRWGLWNAVLERKEYAEDYVLEPLAHQMVEKNPALRREFEQRLKADSTFAASPTARRMFFYQRSPYYDQQYLRYPVARLLKKTELPLAPLEAF